MLLPSLFSQSSVDCIDVLHFGFKLREWILINRRLLGTYTWWRDHRMWTAHDGHHQDIYVNYTERNRSNLGICRYLTVPSNARAYPIYGRILDILRLRLKLLGLPIIECQTDDFRTHVLSSLEVQYNFTVALWKPIWKYLCWIVIGIAKVCNAKKMHLYN